MMSITVSDAPWAVLLAPEMQLPAKFGWLLRHMIALRGVCKGLRMGGSAEFFACVLQSERRRCRPPRRQPIDPPPDAALPVCARSGAEG